MRRRMNSYGTSSRPRSITRGRSASGISLLLLRPAKTPHGPFKSVERRGEVVTRCADQFLRGSQGVFVCHPPRSSLNGPPSQEPAPDEDEEMLAHAPFRHLDAPDKFLHGKVSPGTREAVHYSLSGARQAERLADAPGKPFLRTASLHVPEGLAEAIYEISVS